MVQTELEHNQPFWEAVIIVIQRWKLYGLTGHDVFMCMVHMGQTIFGISWSLFVTIFSGVICIWWHFRIWKTALKVRIVNWHRFFKNKDGLHVKLILLHLGVSPLLCWDVDVFGLSIWNVNKNEFVPSWCDFYVFPCYLWNFDNAISILIQRGRESIVAAIAIKYNLW